MLDGIIVQNAYVVDDLDEAIANWIGTVGAGPFFVKKNLDLTVKYRGRDMPLDIDFALGQSGLVQIELIKVNCRTDNVYTDTYPDGSTCGFHHIAMFPLDLDEAIKDYETKGYLLAMDLMFGDTRVVYMDARHDMGCMIELYQDTPDMRSMYARIAEASTNWEGREPIRSL